MPQSPGDSAPRAGEPHRLRADAKLTRPCTEFPTSSVVLLEQLADALSRRGFDATVITPAPYLAVRVPGAMLPQLIYSTDGQFWWHTPRIIAPSGKPDAATEIITWGLRACTRPTATPYAGREGDQQC